MIFGLVYTDTILVYTDTSRFVYTDTILVYTDTSRFVYTDTILVYTDTPKFAFFQYPYVHQCVLKNPLLQRFNS